VLLSDLSLVVPCAAPAGEREVCSVSQTNGALRWRSRVGGGLAMALAVGRDGTIYTTRLLTGGGAQLAALWGRIAPSTAGWPTEGRNPQHTRRP
jgi:hypothetical protein